MADESMWVADGFYVVDHGDDPDEYTEFRVLAGSTRDGRWLANRLNAMRRVEALLEELEAVSDHASSAHRMYIRQLRTAIEGEGTDG